MYIKEIILSFNSKRHDLSAVKSKKYIKNKKILCLTFILTFIFVFNILINFLQFKFRRPTRMSQFTPPFRSHVNNVVLIESIVDSHCAFGDGHVESVEDHMRLWLGSVFFERPSYADSLRFSCPDVRLSWLESCTARCPFRFRYLLHWDALAGALLGRGQRRRHWPVVTALRSHRYKTHKLTQSNKYHSIYIIYKFPRKVF